MFGLVVGKAGSRNDEHNDTLGVARILMIADIVAGEGSGKFSLSLFFSIHDDIGKI